MKLPPGPTAKRVILIMRRRYVCASEFIGLKVYEGSTCVLLYSCFQPWPLGNDWGWGRALPCSDLSGAPDQWGFLVNSKFILDQEREAVIKSEGAENHRLLGRTEPMPPSGSLWVFAASTFLKFFGPSHLFEMGKSRNLDEKGNLGLI